MNLWLRNTIQEIKKIEDLTKREKIGVFFVSFLFSIAIFSFNVLIFEKDAIFSAFYILPIIIASWYVGLKSGLFLATFCLAEYSFLFIYYQVETFNLSVYLISFIPKMVVYFFIVFILVRLKKSLKAERQLARIDSLTRIGNRKSLFERVELEMNNLRRYNKIFALVFIDIDDFKKINDTSGHIEGDRILKTFANRVNDTIRKNDALFRVGGDEFILILPQTNLEQSKIVMSKIKASLSEPDIQSKQFPTVSAGVGIFTVYIENIEDVVLYVDKLMYKVKKTGKNNVDYFEF